jgi:hypothetical protein
MPVQCSWKVDSLVTIMLGNAPVAVNGSGTKFAALLLSNSTPDRELMPLINRFLAAVRTF